MIPPIIAFALTTGLFTLLIRIIISRHPFNIKNTWTQIISSTLIGLILWAASLFFVGSKSKVSTLPLGDIVCGVLIFLNVFWCSYWSGNFAGGFRVQMQLNLTDQERPLTVEEWMKTFGGLGMDAFLRDRINSVLVPWHTIEEENGKLRLLPGWGTFFGKTMIFLRKIMPKVRSN